MVLHRHVRLSGNRRRAGRRLRAAGFALPMALIALALLYLLVASAFAMSQLESLMGRAHEASVRAFYAADGELEEYLSSVSGLPVDREGSGSDGAVASVRAEPLLDLPFFDRLYRLVSTAAVGAEGRPLGVRTVGTLVLATAPPRLPAAFTALSGTSVGGAAGTISGVDASPAPGCDAEARLSIPGLASPDPVETGPTISGTPPTLLLPSSPATRRIAGLDWAALLDAAGPPRTATIPTERWPTEPPDPNAAWPVIEISSEAYELSVANGGEGTILARGDLTLGQGFVWRGILLVGGSLKLSGSARVRGAILSGLNREVGLGSRAADLRGGTLDLAYDSCYVAAAAAAIALAPVVLPGSWFEEF